MRPTTENELTDLFRATIVALAPRVTYKGAEGWKPYNRENANASTTRRFRFLWSLVGIVPGGAMAGSAIEVASTLRIRTDYTGDNDRAQFCVIDDALQLQDVLSALKSGGTDHGLVLVTWQASDIASDVDPSTDSPTETDDTIRVDHTFEIRYIRRLQL